MFSIVCYVVAVALQFGLFAVLAAYCFDYGDIYATWIMFAIVVLSLVMFVFIGNPVHAEETFVHFDRLCSLLHNEAELT